MTIQIKKIKSYIAKARKVSGIGEVEYCLWVDDLGRLYVELVNNEESGTYTPLVYRIADYVDSYKNEAALKIKKTYNAETGKIVGSDNSNDAGFLKAALLDLLPYETEDK